MKRAVLLLAMVTCASATPIYVLAQEACVQSDFRTVCPVRIVDPNAEAGPVLGPVPADPNSWTVPEGPFKREPAPACDPDPEDQVVAVEYRAGSSPVKVDFNALDQQWSFSTNVPEGPCGYLFAVIDNRGAERLVWVWMIGKPNNPPVLY